MKNDPALTIITVNRAFGRLVEYILEQTDQLVDYIIEQDRTIEYGWDEADYGRLPNFEAALQKKSIPYDRRWEAGEEYAAGREYVRFQTDSKHGSARLSKQHYDHDRFLDALELASLLERGDIAELSKRVAYAVEQTSPLGPPIEEVSFERSHRAALTLYARRSQKN